MSAEPGKTLLPASLPAGSAGTYRGRRSPRLQRGTGLSRVLTVSSGTHSNGVMSPRITRPFGIVRCPLFMSDNFSCSEVCLLRN